MKSIKTLSKPIIYFLIFFVFWVISGLYYKHYTEKQVFKHNEDYEDISFLNHKLTINPLKPETTIKTIYKKIIIKKREVDTIFIDTSKVKVKIIRELPAFNQVRLISIKPMGIQIYEYMPDSTIKRSYFGVKNPWADPIMIYRQGTDFVVTYPRFPIKHRKYISISYSFPSNEKQLIAGETILIKHSLMLDLELSLYNMETQFGIKASFSFKFYF